MSNKIVYLLSHGEYSDYHVVAVLSTPEPALTLIAQRCADDGWKSYHMPDDYRIEPYFLDTSRGATDLEPHVVKALEDLQHFAEKMREEERRKEYDEEKEEGWEL